MNLESAKRTLNSPFQKVFWRKKYEGLFKQISCQPVKKFIPGALRKGKKRFQVFSFPNEHDRFHAPITLDSSCLLIFSIFNVFKYYVLVFIRNREAWTNIQEW